MLKRELITTPLVDAVELPPVTIVPVKELGRFKTLRLVLRAVRFLFGIMWAQRVRHEPPEAIAMRIRNFLEDMGGLWVKAGQLLSLRTDLLSPEMADQLTQLQYRANGFAPEIARQIVTKTLGRPLAASTMCSRITPLRQLRSHKNTAPTCAARAFGWS